MRTSRRATPLPIGLLATVGVAFLAIPLIGLLLRTPWSRLPELLTSPVAIEALRLSLICSLAATAIAIVTGVPLAWVLAFRLGWGVSGIWWGLCAGLLVVALVLVVRFERKSRTTVARLS